MNSRTPLRWVSSHPARDGQQGSIFPRICGAQAKIVGENRRSHPAEKTQAQRVRDILPRICGAQAKIVGENRRSHPAENLGPWNSGSRSTIQVPPLPPRSSMGRFFDPPLKFRPPPPTPPLGLATGADELAHAVALGLKPSGSRRAAGEYFPAHLRGTSENRW